MTKTDSFDAGRARELFDQGLGRNEIARQLGVAAARVTAWAQREGLAFDRASTAAALKARTVDVRARRAALTDRLYARSTAILDRLDAPTFAATIRGTGGSEHVEELDFVPARDERDMAQAVTQMMTAAAKLEALNPQGADATEEARSMLGDLARWLGSSPEPPDWDDPDYFASRQEDQE